MASKGTPMWEWTLRTGLDRALALVLTLLFILESLVLVVAVVLERLELEVLRFRAETVALHMRRYDITV